MTDTPAQPGERVVLDVVSGGAKPELRIATDKTAVIRRRQPRNRRASRAHRLALNPRDLPVIMRALAEMVPTGIPIARAGQTFLRAAVAADLRPAVVEQIQRLLAPLHAALPPAELAPVLRAVLAQSGLFTENHLGAALQERPGPLTADQRHATADVRFCSAR